MLKAIWNSFLFRILLICIAGAVVFVAIGFAIDYFAGPYRVCPIFEV